MSFVCKELNIKSEERTLVDISFDFDSSFALIGESGSGKSLTLKALLKMLPKGLSYQLELENEFELKKGENISLVPQNPFTALSPLTKIKDQFLIENEKAKRYFELVGLDKSFLDRFPSELSGGQLQRIVLAFALSIQPKILLLDEPTTALDADSKEEILHLIKNLHKQEGFYLLFVTHDIDSVKDLCSKVGILKNGKMVESGFAKEVIDNPKTEYTKKLIKAGFKGRKFRL